VFNCLRVALDHAVRRIPFTACCESERQYPVPDHLQMNDAKGQQRTVFSSICRENNSSKKRPRYHSDELFSVCDGTGKKMRILQNG
jgi:hypothetical protein